jgi:hypothetical protein
MTHNEGLNCSRRAKEQHKIPFLEQLWGHADHADKTEVVHTQKVAGHQGKVQQ